MLNARQERFCHEYIIDSNATQAAIRSGYSPRAAGPVASRLLTNANVRARVDELLAEIKSTKIADATEVLETLTRILRREELDGVVTTVTKKRKYVDDNGNKVAEEFEEAQIVEVPTKVYDVNRAAETLAKKYGLLKDGDDSSHPVTVVIDYDYGNDNSQGSVEVQSDIPAGK